MNFNIYLSPTITILKYYLSNISQQFTCITQHKWGFKLDLKLKTPIVVNIAVLIYITQHHNAVHSLVY